MNKKFNIVLPPPAVLEHGFVKSLALLRKYFDFSRPKLVAGNECQFAEQIAKAFGIPYKLNPLYSCQWYLDGRIVRVFSDKSALEIFNTGVVMRSQMADARDILNNYKNYHAYPESMLSYWEKDCFGIEEEHICIICGNNAGRGLHHWTITPICADDECYSIACRVDSLMLSDAKDHHLKAGLCIYNDPEDNIWLCQYKAAHKHKYCAKHIQNGRGGTTR